MHISGLSHGTDVWLGNARDLILKEGKALKDCICCRDDIMEYLISVGIESKLAFAIMETVRNPGACQTAKLKDEWEEKMRAAGVPEWYINSCNKIAYLFPKARGGVCRHGAAHRVVWGT